VIIKSAEFITSAVKPGQYPETGLPEIAFAGRSNVGKSSLINTLINRRNLVKTSATPGKTRLINFFRINDAFLFVDLPGYGYAKVPASEREQWGPMVETYLRSRAELKGVILLQDIRRTPGEKERELIAFMNHIQLPHACIITKADKLSKSKQTINMRQILAELAPGEADLICFSTKTRQGRERAWGTITRMIGIDNGGPAVEDRESKENTELS